MESKWSKESELALSAAASSAEMITIRRAHGLAFHTKTSSRDIVTDIDIAVEEHIRKALSASSFRIVGEETTDNKGLELPIDNPTWFVDPIDGTTNFVSGISFHAVSVGLVSGSKFIIGAVAAPALKELFFTMAEDGAFLNGKALKVAPADLKSSLVVASFSGSVNDAAKRAKEYELFGKINDLSRGTLRLGSASLNICYAAAGRFKAAYGIANKIWDVAGALAVAKQAGCKIYVEWLGGERVSFAAGSGGACDEIVDILKKEKLADLTVAG